MSVKLYPKHADFYLIQFDKVITPLSERAITYILAGRAYADNEGWKTIKGHNIITLPNDVRVIMPDKNDFIVKLKEAREHVDQRQEPYIFEV